MITQKLLKQLLCTTFFLVANVAFSQGVNIKWEDNDGREFSITAPDGEFSYGMIAGDRVSYDYSGRVSKVGTVYISYDYSGRVSKVGGVYISYDYSDRVKKVGGLNVYYDYSGRISRTSGSVNY